MSTMKSLRLFLLEALEKHAEGDLSTPEGREVIADDLFEGIRAYGRAYTIEMFSRSAKAAKEAIEVKEKTSQGS